MRGGKQQRIIGSPEGSYGILYRCPRDSAFEDR